MRALYLLSACIVTSALVLAGCVGVGYRADRPGRFDPVADHNVDLWRVASRECLDAGRAWSQGMVDGVLVGRCSTLPSLGIGPAVARARR